MEDAWWGQVCENEQIEKELYPSSFFHTKPNNPKAEYAKS